MTRQGGRYNAASTFGVSGIAPGATFAAFFGAAFLVGFVEAAGLGFLAAAHLFR